LCGEQPRAKQAQGDVHGKREKCGVPCAPSHLVRLYDMLLFVPKKIKVCRVGWSLSALCPPVAPRVAQARAEDGFLTCSLLAFSFGLCPPLAQARAEDGFFTGFLLHRGASLPWWVKK
jgi:hypothetical protein